MTNQNEKILVDALRKGSSVAFDRLFEDYCDRLHHFVISIIKVPQLAEDIVQEVFIKIWEKRSELDQHKSFKSFVFSIAYNETISVIRRKKTENNYLEQIKEIVSENKILNTPQLEMEFQEINNHIEKVLRDMPERRQQVFRLSREDGLSYREIAEKLKISKNTVENQMVAALKTIRKKIGNGLTVLLFLHLFIF